MPLGVKARLFLSICTIGGSLVLIKALIPIWGDMGIVDQIGASVCCVLLFGGGLAGFYFNTKELDQNKEDKV